MQLPIRAIIAALGGLLMVALAACIVPGVRATKAVT